MKWWKKAGVALLVLIACAYAFLVWEAQQRRMAHAYTLSSPNGKWEALVFLQRERLFGPRTRVILRLHCGTVIARIKLLGTLVGRDDLGKYGAVLAIDDERLRIGPGYFFGGSLEPFETTFQESCAEKGWG